MSEPSTPSCSAADVRLMWKSVVFSGFQMDPSVPPNRLFLPVLFNVQSIHLLLQALIEAVVLAPPDFSL